MCIYIYIYIHVIPLLAATSGKLPVVPHKAATEVSEYETYRRAWLLQITESTDGLKGGWCCHLVGHLTHNCWM